MLIPNAVLDEALSSKEIKEMIDASPFSQAAVADRLKISHRTMRRYVSEQEYPSGCCPPYIIGWAVRVICGPYLSERPDYLRATGLDQGSY